MHSHNPGENKQNCIYKGPYRKLIVFIV